MSLPEPVSAAYASDRSLNTTTMSEHINSILATNALARPRQRDWWGFVWRGLVVSRSAKHYNAMGRALWLFVYLIIHANRRSGDVYRRVRTIAQDIGLSERTVQVWLKVLRDHGYVTTERTGRSLIIHINKWRPISRAPSGFPRPGRVANDGPK